MGIRVAEPDSRYDFRRMAALLVNGLRVQVAQPRVDVTLR